MADRNNFILSGIDHIMFSYDRASRTEEIPISFPSLFRGYCFCLLRNDTDRPWLHSPLLPSQEQFRWEHPFLVMVLLYDFHIKARISQYLCRVLNQL